MITGFRFGLNIFYLVHAIGFTRAAWDTPPFLKPDKLDPAVKDWSYDESIKQTNIELEEEVADVCIAEINYDGDIQPQFGAFTSSNNYALGGVIKKSDNNRYGIYITKKQDYETETMRVYRFEIIIHSWSYYIALNILNIDDNAPVILPNTRNCAVEENYSGRTNCSYTIRDADGWIDQVKVTFKSIPEEGSENFEFQLEGVAGIDKDHSVIAQLNIVKSLDFESINMYMLTMNAMDGAENESNMLTAVEVIDMPDEPPKWMRLIASETIQEKSTKTLSVLAIDGDVQINAEINYKIILAKGHEDLFTIETTTGNITIHPIDRDTLKKEVFKFEVIAYEKKNISSFINATIIVIVEDINDHIPEISPDKFSIDINEETYMTLDFEQPITISDVDLAENAQYTVCLIDNSEYQWSSAFVIVPNSGYQTNNFTISVVNASLLDYEDEHWRHMKIEIQSTEVHNKSHIDKKIIEINLINWNDEFPIFENDTVQVSIPEDIKQGSLIATIFATDRDVDDNVTHSLVAQKSLAINDKSGVIVTSKDDALDFESIPIVIVQIVATDLAKHKSYATLTINVIDVNDVPPTLNLPQSTPSLEEEVEIGTKIEAEIDATDVDTEAKLIFSINWEMTTARKSSVIVNESFYREHLSIETTYRNNDTRLAKGTLVVTGRIDYEAFDVIFIYIVVTDVTTVHNVNSSSASITININDINDNYPKFRDHQAMNVSENQVADTLIGAITATDADGPLYNRISYYIEAINNTADHLIQMNNETGEIRVQKDREIDAEIYEYIYYNVTATDGENNSTMLLTIYVIDINDEVPYLLHNQFDLKIHIPEKSQSGKEIVRIVGRDNDRTHPYNNVSYLINTNYSAPFQYFHLGRFDGLLQVCLSDGHILDRDFGSANYILNLKLRDNHLDDGITWNTNALDTIVTVILDDINDQIPELPDMSDDIIEISEITNKDVLVVTITAEDHDDPLTDNTKVDYKLLNVTFLVDEFEHDPPKYCQVPFNVATVDAKHAQIYTVNELRGCYGTWALQLYAQDRGTNPGPLNDTRIYHIKVTDYNYYAPIIVFPIQEKNIALSQDQELHTQLRTYDMQPLNDFTATDDDYGASGQVTFSISSEKGDYKYFEVVNTHGNSAKLRLRDWPDYEKQDIFKLFVTATDGGIPLKNTSQEVTIIFVSSPDPEYNENEWTVWIKENKTGLNFSQLIPEARDNINENGGSIDIYYFIDDKVGDYQYFHLDKSTRNLSMVKELDREQQELMHILVVATANKDGPPREPKKKATLNITIVVLDENDNAPIFQTNFYSAGVAMEDKIDKIIVSVKATDADLNDTLKYSMIPGSITVSDSSLAGIKNPFYLNSDTGELSLKFAATGDMTGFFSFRIIVYDTENHNDTAQMQVYIVSQKNRVAFTFKNNAAYVKEEQMFVINSFSETFGYVCNVDDIKSSVDNDNKVLDNITTLMSHFIDLKHNLPIASDVVILASGDLQTVTNLKARLQTKSLYLIDVPTGSLSVIDNIQQTIQWILICLTIFFSLSCAGLIVVYYMRTKSLSRRLDKMALEGNVGSNETESNRAGIVPTTNQFSIVGSNPIWSTTEKPINNCDDNISETSGDSNLIGIEDNPIFNCTNDIIHDKKVYKEQFREGESIPRIIFNDPQFKDKRNSDDENTC